MSADHIKTISDKPVLIVGAGPSGLIVVIELARRGVPASDGLIRRRARACAISSWLPARPFDLCRRSLRP